MSTPLIIYSHSNCELCEIAASLATRAKVDWVYEDIRKDLEVLRRYRNCIPVMLNQDTGKELFWPFEEQDIISLAGGAT